MQASTAGKIVVRSKDNVNFVARDIAAERVLETQVMDVMERLEVLLGTYVFHHQV